MRIIFDRTEKSEYDFVRDSRPLLQPCLDELGSSSATWNLTLEDLALGRFANLGLKNSSAGREQKEEDAIYLELASALELDTRAWLERDQKQTDGRRDPPTFGSPTLKEMGLFRRDVLVTAIGRLFHLESVFSMAQLLLSGDVSEGIRMFLEDNDLVILRGPEPVRILGELGDLFLSIGHRQGVNPRRLKVENLVLDRRPSKEGQISTGG